MAESLEELRAQLAAERARADAAEASNRNTAATLGALVAKVDALTATSAVNAHAARVDELQRAGVIQPALRDWALKQSRESLEAYAAAAAPVAAVVASRVEAPETRTAPTQLTAEQRKVIEMTGVSEKDFLEEQALQLALAAERRAQARGEGEVN